ncbi:HU family DNA-binding protein [Metabacillus sp. Hm71]|uniref:HU family DNA-binding protein n=1 Tax=Metabacillus sp. Hm71 TaxID=3450743 RepID=UPI003F425BCC
MNKTELVSAVAGKLEVTKKEAAAIVDSVFEVVLEGLLGEGEVVLGDLGKLQIVERAARTARNPQTGSPIEVPAKSAPKFKPSKKLKDAVK